MKPHKHEKWIKMKAEGALIERRLGGEWYEATWSSFSRHGLEFRVAPIQPADEDGWRPWFGGENPAPGRDVEYKCFLAPEQIHLGKSNALRWNHCGQGGDIVAWREAKTMPQEKPKVKKYRWMYLFEGLKGAKCAVSPNLTPLFATEADATAWCRKYEHTLGPRQDWTEVEE